MANNVRRDVGRIGRDVGRIGRNVGRIGRDVGRIGRCVGRSSGCFQSLWSLAGLVAQSLWAVVYQLICMLLMVILRQLKYQKAMLSGESYLQFFISILF